MGCHGVPQKLSPGLITCWHLVPVNCFNFSSEELCVQTAFSILKFNYHALLLVSMSEQVWGVAQKLAYWKYLTQSFPGCLIRRLSVCARVPHRKRYSIGELVLVNIEIRNGRGRQSLCWNLESNQWFWGPKPRMLSTKLSFHPKSPCEVIKSLENFWQFRISVRLGQSPQKVFTSRLNVWVGHHAWWLVRQMNWSNC